MYNIRDSLPRLRRLVPRLRDKRIVVVGDLMLDRYVVGTASRLSPEAAVPVVDFEEQLDFIGGAGNVAANLAALGAHVECLGVIGNDDAGAALRKSLRTASIGCKGVFAERRRITTVKTRIIARHQQIVRVDRERPESAGKDLEGRLLRVVSALRGIDAVVLSDYDKGLINDDFAARLLAVCHRAETPVFVKPKKSRLYAYRGARVIVCNAVEASFFASRPIINNNSARELAEMLVRSFGCSAVLITRGSEGMSLVEEGSAGAFHIPATGSDARIGQPGVEHKAKGRQVFDVTGAGDTVLSVVALAAAAGATLRDAAMLANIAAGVVVSKLGTATVSPQELTRALDELH
jgi:rfaE bifunctional protein kinase chain/domain